MISAYEHGWSAARRGKHIQACPFDAGTAEWREWRNGFLLSSGQCMPDESAELRGAPRGAEQIRISDTMKSIDSLVEITRWRASLPLCCFPRTAAGR